MSMLKYICKSRQIPENHYQIRLLKTGVLAYVLAYGCFRQSFRQSGFVRERFLPVLSLHVVCCLAALSVQVVGELVHDFAHPMRGRRHGRNEENVLVLYEYGYTYYMY